ncbi:M23 family metallopeptidase [Vibrio ostreicida]|uniref:M23 family metallopeptidase n=1 Tax=Vibrio ostreicida TaxID=526588 RepID=A0ABT8BRN8_9VIBR|nr:M23 family metallopeptidase [Vibrio ostreicida]MDN3609477.1 M23 family metallopeptidase [Vibrio ostreicida]NPD08358.1 M23 family metallopeptidase [Vibrio ostreicida]
MESNQLTVMVSGIQGTRFFNLSFRAIAGIKYTLLFIVVMFVSLIGLLSILADDASDSAKEKTQWMSKTYSLEKELLRSHEFQTDLESSLNRKQQDLAYVTEKLRDIESALKLSNESLDLRERVNIAALNTAVRHQMMQLIPNGKPVRTGYLSSRYGNRIHPVTKTKAMHHGIDYAVSMGTPIYAPADGIIAMARKSNRGSGNFLRITHSFGFTSSYSHLKSFKVERGDYVKKGDLIGLSGNSGLSTGYHLHYEIRLVGRSLDPLPYTQWEMNNFESIFESNKEVEWDYLVKRIESQIATALKLSSRKAPSLKDNSSLLVTSR